MKPVTSALWQHLSLKDGECGCVGGMWRVGGMMGVCRFDGRMGV